jgi:hypothetical protein
VDLHRRDRCPHVSPVFNGLLAEVDTETLLHDTGITVQYR